MLPIYILKINKQWAKNVSGFFRLLVLTSKKVVDVIYKLILSLPRDGEFLSHISSPQPWGRVTATIPLNGAQSFKPSISRT